MTRHMTRLLPMSGLAVLGCAVRSPEVRTSTPQPTDAHAPPAPISARLIRRSLDEYDRPCIASTWGLSTAHSLEDLLQADLTVDRAVQVALFHERITTVHQSGGKNDMNRFHAACLAIVLAVIPVGLAFGQGGAPGQRPDKGRGPEH